MIRRLALVPFLALAVAMPALAQDKTPPTKEPAKTEPAKQPETKPAQQADKLAYAKLATTAGDIVLELNETKAPASVGNFLSYVDKGHYDGTIFHRVIKDFMIQGGGMSKDWSQKPTSKGVKNEWRNGLKNVKYTLAMARIGGDPDSGTSQFFINTKDNDMLDRPQGDGAAYAVFGKVVDGFDTVDKIRDAKVGPDMRGEVSKPAEPVVINSIKRMSDADVAAWKNKTAKPAEKPAAPKEEKKEGK
jgi:cyclophilin family peptidyl-prolyl cis-trans isomerase